MLQSICIGILTYLLKIICINYNQLTHGKFMNELNQTIEEANTKKYGMALNVNSTIPDDRLFIIIDTYIDAITKIGHSIINICKKSHNINQAWEYTAIGLPNSTNYLHAYILLLEIRYLEQKHVHDLTDYSITDQLTTKQKELLLFQKKTTLVD